MSSSNNMASVVDEVDEEYLNSDEYLNKTSEKARYYHALLRKATVMFDAGDSPGCREQCLQLLIFPYLPNYTRIETLHLLAACTNIFINAKGCLDDAMVLIDKIQATKNGKASKHLDNFRQGNKRLMDQAIRNAQFFKENPDYVNHAGDSIDEFPEESDAESESESVVPTIEAEDSSQESQESQEKIDSAVFSSDQARQRSRSQTQPDLYPDTGGKDNAEGPKEDRVEEEK